MKTLFREGADVNAQNNYGVTALLTMIRSRHIKMEKLLLKNGTDVTAKRKKSNSGWASTMCASYYGDIKMMELLLENDGVYTTPNEKDNKGKTALIYANEQGHAEIVQLLKDSSSKAHCRTVMVCKNGYNIIGSN